MSFRYQHGDRPIEGYTILRGVGRGGFGEVYYAVSDGGREVALKSIMYNQEIELRGVRHCINLKSPHLVAIFDVRSGEEGTPFVIMEYVTGPSLRDIIRDHPDGLGSQKAAYLMREIARGLAYLHERGIVHRDLKPENIFYEEGFVKIGDYGLSKFISASHQSGQTMSVGTVHYMAPEIGSGNYHRGIDIYALGVILYEMLTGQVPFTGDSFGEILMKHLTVEPDLTPVEEPFRAVIRGALAKKPDDRFPSVDVMSKQLFASGALDSSVSLFNPATLSQAAGRSPIGVEARNGANGHGAFAETVPVTPPPPIPVAPVPPVPVPPGPAAAPPPPPPPRAPKVPAPAVPAPGRHAADRSDYQAASRKFKESLDEHNRRVQANGTRSRRRLDPSPAEAVPLDPLDSTQRLVRALFVAIVSVIAVRILPTGITDGGGLVAFLLCAGGGGFAVLFTEFKLAQAFQISRGFGWQLVVLATAALPVIFGLQFFRREEELFFAIMLSMLLVDWHARLRPLREERISFGAGFTAGLCGSIFGVIFAGQGLLAGGVLATMSLLVNAFAPFVPSEVRRRWRRQAGEDESDEPSPGGGSPVPHAPPPVPSPREVAGDGMPAPVPGGVAQATAASVAVATARVGEERLPGFPARLFWLFVATALVAGGLSCLIAAFVIDFRPHEGEDLLVCICAGLGLMGYSGFSLYRGLWARRASFWGRSLRPFLLVTTFNAMTVSAACFTLGPPLGAWTFGREETIVAISMLLSSAFLFTVLLFAERLVPRLTTASAAGLPRHERPVHPLRRVFYLCLGGAASIASIVLVSLGTLDAGLHAWERNAALSFSIALGCFALFLFRQGLRRRRGHLWSGAVRPFLLAVVCAAIGVCTLPFFLDLPLRDEEKVAFIIISCFAGAFGVFVFFLRGPDETPESPLLDRFRDLIAVRQETMASSWLGLGTVLWIIGVGVGLVSVVVHTGLTAELPLQGENSAELVEFFATEGPWFASLLLIAGGVSIILARFGSGALHVGRGIIGQVALLSCLFLLASAGSRITVAEGLRVRADLARDELLVFVVFGLLSGALGALLLAWPPRKRRDGGQPADAARKEVA